MIDERVQRFFQGMRGKRVALCGIGRSNQPLIDLFVRSGAAVTACDRRTPEQLGDIAEKLLESGVALRLGADYLKGLQTDILFRTPGMYFGLPELEEFRRRGVVVTSEMEVFFDLCPATVFAVTGSEGKTTTSTLIAEMLRASGKTVHLGGNIGRALLPEIESIMADDFAVVELSSFQLISMRSSPNVAVITNVTPNHLDVHGSMEEYIAAKKNLILHQNAFGCAVLNADNNITAAFAEETRGKTLLFSRRNPVSSGAYVRGDGLVMAENGKITPVLNKSDIRLPGEHNVENYLAAISAVWGYVGIDDIVKVAREFGGVEHRQEFVRELRGARYYNDSIATSPTRTIACLNAFPQKIVLIAGGYDKHIPYEPLAPYLTAKAKTLILCGATADKIERAARADANFAASSLQIVRAVNLNEAVAVAASVAREGDVVALSPASASFDQYPDFEARGAHFKDLVAKLK